MNLNFSNSSTQKKNDTDFVDGQVINFISFADKSKKIINKLIRDDMKTKGDEYSKINIISFEQSFSRLQRNYISDNKNSKNE